mmetsp:Transcript_37273/g.93965  ORF Transcript_37273/g.93965 Transcript_37273/m.93965 type:complete len:226 (-) Transcript_37273:134-811(-)
MVAARAAVTAPPHPLHPPPPSPCRPLVALNRPSQLSHPQRHPLCQNPPSPTSCSPPRPPCVAVPTRALHRPRAPPHAPTAPQPRGCLRRCRARPCARLLSQSLHRCLALSCGRCLRAGTWSPQQPLARPLRPAGAAAGRRWPTPCGGPALTPRALSWRRAWRGGAQPSTLVVRRAPWRARRRPRPNPCPRACPLPQQAQRPSWMPVWHAPAWAAWPLALLRPHAP